MTEGQPLFVQSTCRPRKTTQRGLEDVTSLAVRAEISCLLLALLSVSAFRFSIGATLCSLIRFLTLKITGGGDFEMA
jgi:hypothetical protein